MTLEMYTLTPDRLERIVIEIRLFQAAFGPPPSKEGEGADLASEEAIRDYCLADWPEGEEHQRWLDTAPIPEIADWVLAGGPTAYLKEEETP